MCGVVGVVLKDGIEGEVGLASFHVFDGLQGVQHRGQDGNGILTFEYKPNSFKYGAWISGISFLIMAIFFSIKLFYGKNKLDTSLQ